MKIVLLGNPLPTFKNPLRMAEELATIDCISHGRLVPGWVRGAGSEQIFNNANPAYNREYFNEAHDLILAAWTRPGPFRWEGKHFNYRFINPWVTPYQKPHPPIMIPGVLSPETVVWCAEHKYPYLGLGTALSGDGGVVEHLRRYRGAIRLPGGLREFRLPTARRGGGDRSKGRGTRQGAPLRRWSGGLLATRAHAAAGLQLQRGDQAAGPHDDGRFGRLPGCQRGATRPFEGSRAGGPTLQQVADSTRRRMARGEATVEEAKAAVYKSYPKAVEGLQIIAGTPKSVIPKLRRILETLRPGTFGVFQSQGPVSFEDRMTSIRLLGQEVLPAVREIGKELGIVDQYERASGSRPHTAGTRREELVSLEAMRA